MTNKELLEDFNDVMQMSQALSEDRYPVLAYTLITSGAELFKEALIVYGEDEKTRENPYHQTLRDLRHDLSRLHYTKEYAAS